MERIVEAHFQEWATKRKFQWLTGLKRLAFEVIATNLFGPMTGTELAALQSDYEKVSAGLVSAPIPLPFTRYGHALQAKKRAFDVLRRIVKARKGSPQGDGVSLILKASYDGQQLTEEQAVLEIHHVVLAGFIVFGHLVTAILRVTREKQAREKLSAAVAALPRGEALTVEGLGQIHYLQQFVMEVKRLSPIIPVLFGRAKKDFELHGVRIPSGWRVVWAVRSTNIYRHSFPHRLDFGPGRYSPFPEREQELHEHLIFVPQGGGPVTRTHACAGFDYSALLTSVFTAILVRDYRWQISDSDPEYNWRSNPPEPLGDLSGTVISLH
jgi:cytochrome P450